MTMGSSEVGRDESALMLSCNGAVAVAGRADCRLACAAEGAQRQQRVPVHYRGSHRSNQNESATAEAVAAAHVEMVTGLPTPCQASRCPSVPSSALPGSDTWGVRLDRLTQVHTQTTSLVLLGKPLQLDLQLPPR